MAETVYYITAGLPGNDSESLDTGECIFRITAGLPPNDVAALDLEQEGFRFRDDDGSEAAATWLAAQDIDITRAKEMNTRLRILLNTTGDQDAKQFKLQYKKTSDSTWRDMPVSL